MPIWHWRESSRLEFSVWSNDANMRILFVSTRTTRLVQHWYFHHLTESFGTFRGAKKQFHTARQMKRRCHMGDIDQCVSPKVHLKNIGRVCPRWVSSFLFILRDLNTFNEALYYWYLTKKKQPTWYYHPQSKIFFLTKIIDCGDFRVRPLSKHIWPLWSCWPKSQIPEPGDSRILVSVVVVVVVVGGSGSSMCFLRSLMHAAWVFWFFPGTTSLVTAAIVPGPVTLDGWGSCTTNVYPSL